ncbi:hypothetical protein C8F04DRAFT_1191212 [Mycena alexandri]|uniref:HNH nuclease domain-containing protein n=1 Tax=Mycena alexandri TaxID=1745969 RepID=A0AAD6SHK5_9AGAR|nr:hypothetical protein C8F04DRAFT_1191212 [Mycena alexandri]
MSSSVLPAITARPPKTYLPLLDAHSKVDIYHPNVHSGPPILPFRAFPSEPDSGMVGVPLGIVLDACFVVAGNQPGELHLYALPQERVAGADSDPDGLLVPGMYHFVVVQAGGGLDYNYHLCGSFAAWTPPVEIPTRWLGGEAARAPPPPNISNISAAVKSDDKVCIMTGAATGLQASHLVPKAKAEWFFFHYRVLAGYGGDPEQDLNSVRNEVTLRADLTGQFDQGLFLFAPYADRVVAVFAKIMAQDLAHEYHLRAIDFPTRIRRGYLFIRFAWNVLKFLTPGLADAAAAIRPLEERPDGGGFLKRKRADDAGGGSKKPKKGGIGGDGARKREDVGGRSGGGGADEDVGGANDGDGELAENGESAPTTEDEDEAQLAVFETLDAALKTRPLTVDDVQAGRYPGFASIKRLEREYRRAHPQVSAVGDPRVWEEGDDD